MFPSILSYISWDPNPDLFTIPYFDHPLKWYGLLFMSGIMAGFFILIPLFRARVRQLPLRTERNVANWKNVQLGLQAALNTPLNPLHDQIQFLSQEERREIQSPHELPTQTKDNILKNLSSLDRNTVENHLKTGLNSSSELAYHYVDKLLWWIIIGTVIGARLGHVFFYQWPYYSENPLSIFKVWEGGLASHGGTVGILLAIYFYARHTKFKYPEVNFLALLDLLTIPTAFGVVFIRIGNFVNQEIIGTATKVPWAVIFKHPADYASIVPRHPVQLYEALAYLLTFILLSFLWKLKKGLWGQGFISGLFFIAVFGSRFFLEYFKMPQAANMIDESFLQMGQLLSLPFVALGFVLIYLSQRRGNHDIISKQFIC